MNALKGAATWVVVMLAVGTPRASGEENPTRNEVVEALGAMRVDFPEPEKSMALGEFADLLGQLCEGKSGNVGVRFAVGEGDWQRVVELVAQAGEEPVGALLDRAGIDRSVGVGGEVILTPMRVDKELVALLNEVVAEKFQVDDTDAAAAVGYILRLYAQGKAEDGKVVKFVPGASAGRRRITLALSRIPLGQAMKYVVQLGGAEVRYDAKTATVTMVQD